MKRSICWGLCLIALASCTTNRDQVADRHQQESPSPSQLPSIEDDVQELTATRVPLGEQDQPGVLLYDRGTLWVGGSHILELEDDRIVERLRSTVSRYHLSLTADLLWGTGGGDGAVPDGTLVAYDTSSGEMVERRVFPNRSPGGVAATRDATFLAFSDGDLWRITDEDASSVPLSEGLNQVLIAHDAVWVSAPATGKVWRVEFHGIDDTNAAATDLRHYPKKTCPQGLEHTRDAIWVADPCAKKVWLLDPRSGEVIDEITGLGKPIDISISAGRAWVVAFRGNFATVLDLQTLTPIARGKTGKGAVAIEANKREAWVANHEDYSLTHFKLP